MRLKRSLARLLLPLALSTAPACGRRDVKLLPGLADAGQPADGAGAKADGAGAKADGGEAKADGAEASLAPACTGLGAPIRLPTSGGSACAAGLAARTHTFVLCSCAALSVTARLRTDAFDSTGAAVDGTTAALGVNGGLQSTAEVRASGAIHVAGAAGIRAGEHLQSGRSLRAGGPIAQLASNADVAGDAYAAGDLTGDVRVDGALHVPAAAAVSPEVRAASVVRETVAVAAPCACDPGIVDVAAAIASAAAHNDDATASLTGAITTGPGAPLTVSLPCGTFHVSGIDTQAPLTLAVHGHALLAVAGDVVLRAGLTVSLDAGAELDLLVGGRLQASGGPVGNQARPAAFRIWIGGSQSIVLDDVPVLGAVVTAPAGAVTAPRGLVLYGALLVGSLTSGAELQLHFDQAVLAAGGVCGEAAAPSPP